MRRLVISDIHGCLDEFNDLLKLVNYVPSHDQLILLGDYVDRGPKSKEVVQRVMELSEHEHVIVLRGNHDERFLQVLNWDSELYDIFIKYGGKEALQSYCPDAGNMSIHEVIQYINQEFYDHIDFLQQTKLYYEDNDFIYVHAGLDPAYPNWKEQPPSTFYTIRDEFVHNKTNVDRKVIFGHVNTNKIHQSSTIWFSEDKIGIDGGCAMGHRLNCLEIIDRNTLNEYYVKSSTHYVSSK